MEDPTAPTKPCPNKAERSSTCCCTYSACERCGVCYNCIEYHLKNKQLPGSCFPLQAEATYDRSFAAFARAWNL